MPQSSTMSFIVILSSGRSFSNRIKDSSIALLVNCVMGSSNLMIRTLYPITKTLICH